MTLDNKKTHHCFHSPFALRRPSHRLFGYSRHAAGRHTVMLSAAKEALTTSLTVRTETDEPFELGKTQWNLGDLALARFELDPDTAHFMAAEEHIRKARALLVDGSDHQTKRCDDLLARIAEARETAAGD